MAIIYDTYQNSNKNTIFFHFRIYSVTSVSEAFKYKTYWPIYHLSSHLLVTFIFLFYKYFYFMTSFF